MIDQLKKFKIKTCNFNYYENDSNIIKFKWILNFLIKIISFLFRFLTSHFFNNNYLNIYLFLNIKIIKKN